MLCAFSPMPTGYSHVNVLGEGSEFRDPNTTQFDFLETYLVNCSMQFILEQVGRGPWVLLGHAALRASVCHTVVQHARTN